MPMTNSKITEHDKSVNIIEWAIEGKDNFFLEHRKKRCLEIIKTISAILLAIVLCPVSLFILVISYITDMSVS